MTGDNVPSAPQDARGKLLDAAVKVIREKGYAATSVQDLCDAAGVTKGAFFHHFRSKDDLGVAAAEYWDEMATALFAAAPYHAPDDPIDRVLGYVDFRKSLLEGPVPEFTCLVGTILQEAYGTHPAVGAACAKCIGDHAATLAEDIEAALRARRIDADWSAESLALFAQAVLQGAFILAKGQGGREVAEQSLDHLRRYLEGIFGAAPATSGS